MKKNNAISSRFILTLIYITITILVIFCPNALISQTNFFVPLQINGSNIYPMNLVFGVHWEATYCTDNYLPLYFDYSLPLIIENELPPKPPSDVFDVRFIDNRTGAGKCMGEGLLYDIKRYTSPTQIDTHRISLQIGSEVTPPFILTWPAGLSLVCDSIKIGQTITTAVRMDQINRTTFSEEVTSLRIWKFGAKLLPPNPPVAPVLLSPDSGAINVPPQNILFQWSGSLTALKYFIEIAVDPAFNNIIIQDSTNFDLDNFGNYIKKNLNLSTTYYWRVRAKNYYGFGPYSKVFSFRTESPYVPPPPAPYLIFPNNGMLDVTKTPTLGWYKTINTERYHLQLSTSANFTSLLINDSTLTDSSKQVNLKGGVTYYWKVRSWNPSGYSPFSTTFSFTTVLIIPPAPMLVYPANNDTTIPLNPLFRWRSSEDTENYHLQIATDPNFNEIVFNDAAITDTCKALTLSPLIDYYWRVRAYNPLGSSQFSEVWQFKTIGIIGEGPTLIAPLNGSSSNSNYQTLRWNPVIGAMSYGVQLALDSNFNSIISDEIVTTNYYLTNELQLGQRYYWRVNARFGSSVSVYSSVWNFRLCITSPSSPVIIYPKHNTINVSLTPTLTFVGSPDATFYILDVHKRSDINWWHWTVVYRETLYTTSKTIGPLMNESVYSWRIVAYNACGNTKDWDWHHFTTIVSKSHFTTFTQVEYSQKSNKDSYSPNAGNARENVYKLNAWPKGLVLGIIPRYDEARNYGWIHLKKYNNVWWKFLPHTGTSRGFDVYGNVKWRGPRYCPYLRLYNNHLVGELITLKYNIGISDVEITPSGFGDLIYSDSTKPDSYFNGKTIRQLCDVTDTALTYYAFKTEKWWMFIELDSILSRINRAFNGPMVVKSHQPLKIKGIQSVDNIHYLHANPNPAPYTPQNIVDYDFNDDELPENLILHQNYPNPFNPATTIDFNMQEEAIVSLKVYNILGQQVDILIDCELLEEGYHTINYNAAHLVSGIYYYIITVEGSQLYQDVKKMVLIK